MLNERDYQKIMELWEKNPDSFREKVRKNPITTLEAFGIQLDEKAKQQVKEIRWGDEDLGRVLQERVSRAKL